MKIVLSFLLSLTFSVFADDSETVIIIAPSSPNSTITFDGFKASKPVKKPYYRYYRFTVPSNIIRTNYHLVVSWNENGKSKLAKTNISYEKGKDVFLKVVDENIVHINWQEYKEIAAKGGFKNYDRKNNKYYTKKKSWSDKNKPLEPTEEKSLIRSSVYIGSAYCEYHYNDEEMYMTGGRYRHRPVRNSSRGFTKVEVYRHHEITSAAEVRSHIREKCRDYSPFYLIGESYSVKLLEFEVELVSRNYY